MPSMTVCPRLPTGSWLDSFSSGADGQAAGKDSSLFGGLQFAPKEERLDLLQKLLGTGDNS